MSGKKGEASSTRLQDKGENNLSLSDQTCVPAKPKEGKTEGEFLNEGPRPQLLYELGGSGKYQQDFSVFKEKLGRGPDGIK